MDSRGLQ